MKPILLNIPESFETERLILRCSQPGDGPEVNAAIHETLEDLKPWMPSVHPAPSVDNSEAYLREQRSRYMQRSNFHFSMYGKEDPATFIGSVGLHPIDWEVPSFEIGYWSRKRFEGQGYISEAVAAVVSFALDTLESNRLVIRCDSENARSRRVAERAGFQLEGKHRCDHKRIGTGDLRNMLYFSLIRSDREHAK